MPLIAQALQQDSPTQQRSRREFAATHTWESSVAKIYEAIMDYAGRQPGSFASAPSRYPQHTQPAA